MTALQLAGFYTACALALACVAAHAATERPGWFKAAVGLALFATVFLLPGWLVGFVVGVAVATVCGVVIVAAALAASSTKGRQS